nr:MAG TPA_asm: hypothetical protein [Bacteriophage sp.]
MYSKCVIGAKSDFINSPPKNLFSRSYLKYNLFFRFCQGAPCKIFLENRYFLLTTSKKCYMILLNPERPANESQVGISRF